MKVKREKEEEIERREKDKTHFEKIIHELEEEIKILKS
jgi:hypothetical protein